MVLHEWQKEDLKYIWHPCSQMKDYEEFPPIVIEKGEGVYLYDIDGNKYMDVISSWWVNIFGHCNKRINEALKKQVDTLEHVIFANFSHKPAIELARKIVEITPPGLNKVFFADNGSSAVEVALKLSFQFHQQTGNHRKQRFITLSDAYHGETIGALSMGDIDLYTKIYKPLLINTMRVKGPDCFRCEFHQKRDSCSAECFVHMEEIVVSMHQEICAVIIEPMVQAAAGMKIYSPVYLKKLRKLCSDYAIHIIADEIAVGFGRTGKMFAVSHADIAPDIMCLSKGLTAGYLPLSLVLTTDEMYQAFYDDYVHLKAFMHSHSYTGNPLSCSVALESLKIFEEENIIEKNKYKSEYIKKLAEPLADQLPYVGEFRQLGMISAIELVKDKHSKEPFEWQRRVGYQIYKKALKKGLLLRPLGNVLYFIPPYVITEEEIAYMVEKTFEAIEEWGRSSLF